MTSARSHPLDVDLADLVDGILDAADAARVRAHLGDCLLCRIKQLRLLTAPPAGEPWSFPSPAFVAPAVDGGAEPAPGELWLAGEGERILVLVLRTLEDRALVAPVTFDNGAADDEAVLVEALGMDAVLYPALATEVPRAVLVGKLPGTVTAPHSLRESVPVSARRTGLPGRSLPDGPRGSVAASPSDPRLELRQLLADHLVGLEEVDLDPSTAADAPPPQLDQIRSKLIADLRAFRGSSCAVQALDAWPGLLAADRDGWAPLATVDEIGVVLVVFDTPHGLVDDADFDTARAVLTRFNASALVVLAGALSGLADVFDAPALNHGIDMPSGAHTAPRPLISGLAAFDAIAKFLDQHSGARAMSPPTRGPVARVDVADLLRTAAADAAADAARQGARFKIAPKRRGYESLAGVAGDLGHALGRAFTDESVVEALLRLAAIDERPE